MQLKRSPAQELESLPTGIWHPALPDLWALPKNTILSPVSLGVLPVNTTPQAQHVFYRVMWCLHIATDFTKYILLWKYSWFYQDRLLKLWNHLNLMLPPLLFYSPPPNFFFFRKSLGHVIIGTKTNPNISLKHRASSAPPHPLLGMQPVHTFWNNCPVYSNSKALPRHHREMVRRMSSGAIHTLALFRQLQSLPDTRSTFSYRWQK